MIVTIHLAELVISLANHKYLHMPLDIYTHIYVNVNQIIITIVAEEHIMIGSDQLIHTCFKMFFFLKKKG